MSPNVACNVPYVGPFAFPTRIRIPYECPFEDRLQNTHQGMMDDAITIRGRTDLAFFRFVDEETAFPAGPVRESAQFILQLQ